VFFEVIRYYYQRIQQTSFLGDLDPSTVEQPHEFLGILIRQLYDAHDISPKLHREITGMRYSDPEVDRLISAEETKTIEAIRQLLEHLGPVLAVDDPEAAAHIVHRSAEEVIHSIKILGSAVDPERLLAELQAMLDRYLFGPRAD